MIKLNGEIITPTIFPDKTSQVWKIPDSALNHYVHEVEWVFEQEAEIIHLLQLKDLLKKAPVHLYMPYLPYGRQDKEISNYSTFARETFLKLLENMNFADVSCFDAHSPSWIKSKYPRKQVAFAAVKTGSDVLVYPDKGAKEKYQPLFSDIFDSIFADKLRDQSTGDIKSIEIVGDCKDKKVLIVDDICDGGMTFILLANALYKSGAKEVNLYVSHGLFTKGLEPLKNANIKQIFTKEGLKNDTSN